MPRESGAPSKHDTRLCVLGLPVFAGNDRRVQGCKITFPITLRDAIAFSASAVRASG
jgi:hypothetical protein